MRVGSPSDPPALPVAPSSAEDGNDPQGIFKPPPPEGAAADSDALRLDPPSEDAENGLGGGKLGGGAGEKLGMGGGANEGAGGGANAGLAAANADSVPGRSNVLPPVGPRIAPKSLPAVSERAAGACVKRSMAAL